MLVVLSSSRSARAAYEAVERVVVGGRHELSVDGAIRPRLNRKGDAARVFARASSRRVQRFTIHEDPPLRYEFVVSMLSPTLIGVTPPCANDL